MKKIFGFLALFFLFLLLFTQKAKASDICDIGATDITAGEKTTITLVNKTDQEETYLVSINPPGGAGAIGLDRICLTVPAHGNVSFSSSKGIQETGVINVAAWRYSKTFLGLGGCDFGNEGALLCKTTFTSRGLGAKCDVEATDIHPGKATHVTVKNTSGEQLKIKAIVHSPKAFESWTFPSLGWKTLDPEEIYSFQHTINPTGKGPWTSKVEVFTPVLHHEERICFDEFRIDANLEEGKQALEHFRPQPCVGKEGIETALGCIPTEIDSLIPWFLRYAISIAGGIAFLMIIFSAFQMITSSGDPEKLEKAKQRLGAAIAGLLFIIFAVFLLQVIGADILKIF